MIWKHELPIISWLRFADDLRPNLGDNVTRDVGALHVLHALQEEMAPLLTAELN